MPIFLNHAYNRGLKIIFRGKEFNVSDIYHVLDCTNPVCRLWDCNVLDHDDPIKLYLKPIRFKSKMIQNILRSTIHLSGELKISDIGYDLSFLLYLKEGWMILKE